MMNTKKIQKLTNIARLYYEENKTQSEIAKLYNISRPLVSRILKEAKEAGIVTITIKSPIENKEDLLYKLKNQFNIYGFSSVSANINDNITNTELAECTINHIHSLNKKYLGIGWGTIIGKTASIID